MWRKKRPCKTCWWTVESDDTDGYYPAINRSFYSNTDNKAAHQSGWEVVSLPGFYCIKGLDFFIIIYLFKTHGFYQQVVKKIKEAAGLYDQKVVTFYILWSFRWHLQLISVVREGFCLCLKRLLARSTKMKVELFCFFSDAVATLNHHDETHATLAATLAVRYQEWEKLFAGFQRSVCHVSTFFFFCIFLLMALTTVWQAAVLSSVRAKQLHVTIQLPLKTPFSERCTDFYTFYQLFKGDLSHKHANWIQIFFHMCFKVVDGCKFICT